MAMFLGVAHLLPLPGAPRQGPGLGAVVERALVDAAALDVGGADGVMIENFGDAPFARGAVSPATVAAITRVAVAVRQAHPRLAVGINVLRNDALAALGVACAVDARWIRVNVHSGAMLTDQGLIEGRARETLLERRRLQAHTAILADLDVKHAVQLARRPLRELAIDTWTRGGVAGMILTGAGTGQPLDPDDITSVREAVPQAKLWAGSGLDPDRAASLAPQLDGAIVGTWLHHDRDLSAPLAVERVREMAAALASATTQRGG